jgi:hypothetical protein
MDMGIQNCIGDSVDLVTYGLNPYKGTSLSNSQQVINQRLGCMGFSFYWVRIMAVCLMFQKAL